jgi:NADPH:quinone reductase-like Zn-dependent oxidoreductase
MRIGEGVRAIVIHETGGPEVLKLENVPDPEPGPGQVLIRTEAIGVSYTEAALRAGGFPLPAPLPAVFGFEAAGVVTETGDGVDKALTGRRVVIMNTGLGSYAEYVTAAADTLAFIPEDISSQHAVAVANFGAVALCLLRKANLTGTETVLVEAAAGGVGGYLTQLAHELGAKTVIGTAGSQAKREYAYGIGADQVIDHSTPDWADQLKNDSVDAVFESFSGDSTGKLLTKLAPGTGRIMLYGFLQGPPAITAMDLLGRGLTLVGCGGMPGWLDRVLAARQDVFRLVADGRLTPQIDSVLPLEEAASAHQRFDTRKAIGKIILTP